MAHIMRDQEAWLRGHAEQKWGRAWQCKSDPEKVIRPRYLYGSPMSDGEVPRYLACDCGEQSPPAPPGAEGFYERQVDVEI